jgi:class 3 adenylate cyclase/pimeloyl-ACP methyl ester carboxylesterase
VDGGDVRYAQNAGVSIAYQVIGDGPEDLVFVCGTMSHLQLWWAEPLATLMLSRLAGFARVIMFDKPGTGLSDPVAGAPTIEQRASDVLAVMDAAQSAHAVLVGFSEGGIPSITLAATRPDRVRALVLLSAWVASEFDPELGLPREIFDRIWAALDTGCARWGEGTLLTAMAPSWAAHPVYSRLLPSIERACMSPGMARSILQAMHGYDVREAAAAVHVPTLVLHAPETLVDMQLGVDLARRIDGATFVELAGPDHLPWIHNAEAIPDEIETFLTGAAPRDRDDGRVMTTVVFTDIVNSTQLAAAGGDERWRSILAAHDERMDELLPRFDGVAIKHTGDGRMARFARPARALRFALAMTDSVTEFGLEIRVGVHTGECEITNADVRGLSVHIAARVAGLAGPGEVLTTSTVRELVIGSGIAFTDRGRHKLKGVPGEWNLVRCDGDRPASRHAYDTDARSPTESGASDRPLRLRDRAVVFAAQRAPRLTRTALATTKPSRISPRAKY